MAAQPDDLFTLRDEMQGCLWPKVIGAPEGSQAPPLAPSRFREVLRMRRFINGADFDIVCELYE